MTTLVIRQIDEATFDELGATAGVPLEQTVAWWEFDSRLPGRRPWRALSVADQRPDGSRVEWALIRFTEFTGRGFTYLWAKHGPVWLIEPDGEAERALRSALVAYVRAHHRRVDFIRLHAWHRAEDTRELLQSITYDRTVVLELLNDDEALMASFKSRGRRDVRKSLRENTDLVFDEETGLDQQRFNQLYQVLVETGQRNDFGIHSAQMYHTMLQALGPDHARIFSVARNDGEPLGWGMVIRNGQSAAMFYAASSHEGRRIGAVEFMYWHAMRALRADGVRWFDFMGVASDRAPSLGGVTTFKRKFAEDTEVAGAWDVPTRRARYELLVNALQAKRRVSAVMVRWKSRALGVLRSQRAE